MAYKRTDKLVYNVERHRWNGDRNKIGKKNIIESTLHISSEKFLPHNGPMFITSVVTNTNHFLKDVM